MERKPRQHEASLLTPTSALALRACDVQMPEGVEGRIELRDVVFDYPVRGTEGEGDGSSGDLRAGPLLNNFSLTMAAPGTAP